MRAAPGALLAACASATLAWAAASITPFYSAAPGASLPPGWSELRVPGVAPAQVALVADGGTTVLQVRAQAAGGAASYRLRADTAREPMLSWRWKVDRVVEKADLTARGGDDFAARVYVFFDIAEADLPLAAQVRIKLARLFYGTELPTAAICYVWDNRHAPGTSAWNPYTDRVRTVVVESGRARAGRWVDARRDLEADFRAAFGVAAAEGVPDITGIAAGSDTDQTGESATAWFADFRLGPRP